MIIIAVVALVVIIAAAVGGGVGASKKQHTANAQQGAAANSTPQPGPGSVVSNSGSTASIITVAPMTSQPVVSIPVTRPASSASSRGNGQTPDSASIPPPPSTATENTNEAETPH